ncbi:hypothetical protein D3C75_972730 [compost metagenome]
MIGSLCLILCFASFYVGKTPRSQTSQLSELAKWSGQDEPERILARNRFSTGHQEFVCTNDEPWPSEYHLGSQADQLARQVGSYDRPNQKPPRISVQREAAFERASSLQMLTLYQQRP